MDGCRNFSQKGQICAFGRLWVKTNFLKSWFKKFFVSKNELQLTLLIWNSFLQSSKKKKKRPASMGLPCESPCQGIYPPPTSFRFSCALGYSNVNFAPSLMVQHWFHMAELSLDAVDCEPMLLRKCCRCTIGGGVLPAVVAGRVLPWLAAECVPAPPWSA